jgi:hypothetical protein
MPCASLIRAPATPAAPVKVAAGTAKYPGGKPYAFELLVLVLVVLVRALLLVVRAAAELEATNAAAEVDAISAALELELRVGGAEL